MPQASMIYPTSVVNGRNNAGFHPQGKRAYRRAVRKIQDCLLIFREPRLYHLCFQGQTNRDHKQMLQALVQKLDRKGIPREWFSARETDSEKGEHLHVFMLVDSSEVRAQSVLNSYEDCFLGNECLKRGILLYVNAPRNALHGNNRYAALPYLGAGSRPTELGQARLKDGLAWLSYIYKVRGKPTVEDKKANGQIFSSSRPNRKSTPDRTAILGSNGNARPIIIPGGISLRSAAPAILSDGWALDRAERAKHAAVARVRPQ